MLQFPNDANESVNLEMVGLGCRYLGNSFPRTIGWEVHLERSDSR